MARMLALFVNTWWLDAIFIVIAVFILLTQLLAVLLIIFGGYAYLRLTVSRVISLLREKVP
jgi:hypothetical protein